jgi:hypothetical protein
MSLPFLFVSPLAESDTALATARPARAKGDSLPRPGSRELNDISAVNNTPVCIGITDDPRRGGGRPSRSIERLLRSPDGVVCGGGHGADGWVDLESLRTVTQVYAQTILTYLG